MVHRGHFGRLAILIFAALLLAACGPADDQPDEVAEEPVATDDADDADASDPETPAEGIDGPDVRLTLGHPFPDTHVISENVLHPFVEEVLEETQGTVEIELHPGGALGGGPATYENVVGGAQDIGFALHGYTPGRFPLVQIVELPFMFVERTAEDATQALWALYEDFDEFRAEYDDVKVLALWVHPPGDLWTRNTRVETLEDVSGLTLRAPGPVTNSLIEQLGASPVGMPAPELYDSLERDVIDGLMIGAGGVNDFGLFEVLDYGLKCDCYLSPMFIVMNNSSWEQLSPDQQAIIDEKIGEPLSLRAAQAYDDNEDQAAEFVTTEGGIEMVHPDDDELSRWHAAGDETIRDWIDEREAEGMPGQAMYDRLVDLVEGAG